jgi:molybdate transport repressor ModE-like protein
MEVGDSLVQSKKCLGLEGTVAGDGLDIDPRRLLILRAVAQTGSLAGAARKLGWTQPAVSQQMRQLERELGVEILARSARGAVLTATGRSLVRHADGIASRLSAAAEEILTERQREARHLRIAAFPSAGKALVLPALSRLATTRPELTASLIVAEPDEARAMLGSDAADIAVVFAYRREREAATFERHVLLTESIYAILPGGHRLAGDPSLSLAALRGERWIAGCDRCRENLVTVCAAVGFTPDIRHSLDDFVLVQHLVADGLGVALLPSLAFSTFRHPSIAIRALPGLGSREIACLIAPDALSVPTIAAAMEALEAAAMVAEQTQVGPVV